MWIVAAVIAFLSAMATILATQNIEQADRAKAVHIAMEGEQLHSTLSVAHHMMLDTSCRTGFLSWNDLVKNSRELGLLTEPSQAWCGDSACSKRLPARQDHVLGGYVVCGVGGEFASYRLGSRSSQHRVYADLALRSYSQTAKAMQVGFADGKGNVYRVDGSRISVSESTATGLLKNLPVNALVVLGKD